MRSRSNAATTLAISLWSSAAAPGRSTQVDSPQSSGIPIIPKVASAFCAFGEVVADLRHDYSASYAERLRAVDLQRLNDLLDGLETTGRSELAEEGTPPELVSVTRSLELRYLGQVHEVAVSLPHGRVDEAMLDRIERLFHERHEALYSYSESDGVCELINLSVTVRGKVPRISTPPLGEAEDDDPTPALKDNRLAFFPEFDGYIETPVFDGSLVVAGNVFVGPAIVEEPTTTIVVFPGSTMRLDNRGFYVMSIPSTGSEPYAAELRAAAATRSG